jgi:hypothetical protein
MKSSSSSSSAPPHNKNTAKNEIKFSSNKNVKLICGIITKFSSIVFKISLLSKTTTSLNQNTKKNPVTKWINPKKKK